jgi:S1-C subfamily serine protease
VTRGWIGAGVQELTPELAESFKLGDANGVLITEVIKNSPAEKSGIKTGDILLAIDTQPINNWSAMLETIANTPPGKIIAVEVARNGAKQTLQVKVGKRPQANHQ